MFTKTQFVESLRQALPDVFTTKVSAEKAFDAFCETLAKGIKTNEGVRLPNVGTFAVNVRASRSGRNPQTGKEITIPEKRVVKFSTSKVLKESLNP